MKRYIYDTRGYFTGQVLNLTKWDSYPSNSTDQEPPSPLSRWDNTQWNIVAEIPEHVKVPEVVTRMQALVAMKRAGILGQVRSIFNGQPNDNEDRLKFEEASSFHRHDDLIAAMAEELSLTSEDLDNLFIEAANIT